MSKKKETIAGFDIPKRRLTKEEKSLKMSWERIDEFHHLVGEDLLDQVGYLLLTEPFLGFLMAKEPHLSKKLIACFGKDKNGDSLLSMGYVFDKKYKDNGKLFYTYFAEYINLTEKTLARFNQVLIQVAEHYKN